MSKNNMMMMIEELRNASSGHSTPEIWESEEGERPAQQSEAESDHTVEQDFGNGSEEEKTELSFEDFGDVEEKCVNQADGVRGTARPLS